tara:strand:+ start:69 stop:290 length:222 start_codon:yes stop_codon:yes gene_type:complete
VGAEDPPPPFPVVSLFAEDVSDFGVSADDVSEFDVSPAEELVSGFAFFVSDFFAIFACVSINYCLEQHFRPRL